MQASSYLFTPSFAQQRLWLLDQLEPASAQYNIVTALRLTGQLDRAALTAAINAVVRRHESLRTVFLYQDDVLHQRCLESLTLELEVSEADGADPHSVEHFMREACHTCFDLTSAPLLRCRLLRVADDQHVLALTMHHIVSDGWSAEILGRELAHCYRAYRDGAEPALPELEIQYADFAEWQRGAADQLEPQLRYWTEQLRATTPIALPHDRPRPARQSFKGGCHYFDLPPAVTARIADSARAQGHTLFIELLTAFYVLLHRYTGQSDLVVGSPVSGRGRLELENLIGFFVNTLALRVDVQPDASFADLLQQVRRVVLDGQSHQDVTFDRVVQALRPERDLSHAPVFQVMFAYQESSGQHWQFDGLAVERLDIPTDTSKFDLTLSLDNVDGQVRCALEYSSDLFDAATMVRLGQHFTTLLTQVAEGRERPIGDFALLSAAEQATLLSCWEQPVREFPVEECLHQAFERQVRLTPDAVALCAGKERLTYRALNARANQLANYIGSALGASAAPAGPRALIGICLPRQEDLVVAILAVLKAGYGYLPIDPALSPERIGFYVSDSQVSLVITDTAHSELFYGTGVDSVDIDGELLFILSMSDEDLDLPCHPLQLAYVIYTSGSTGTPKGVMVAHQNVMRLFSATDAWFGFRGDDVWTLFHSTAFDFSVWEIWGALLYGGRLVVVPYVVSRSPEAFHQLVIDEGVTVLNQTPSAFKQFSAADAASSAPAGALKLRYVVFGGEALEPSSLRAWIARHGDTAPQLVNMYGITETTVHVTYRPITAADAERSGASPIGVAIPDLRMFILDARLRPVPIGVTGEIYVAGAGVASGYLKREELTAERFIAWPETLVGAPGYSEEARLYKTGDLARFLAYGSVEYQGRADDQVKIRGFRIELGEIEAALRQVDGVRETTVTTVRDGEGGDARLVAYVVSGTAELRVEQLRAALKTTLPDYMVPASFVFLDALPLTHNGKIDRKALPAPASARPRLASDYAAPSNDIERQLVDIWCAVLGLDQVGVDDNFFALGGDSLRGVQAIGRARALGLPLALVDLFAHQSIAALAGVAARQASAGTRPAGARQPFTLINEQDRVRLPDGAVDAYPLSRMQGAMFYHMQLAPESNVYHCTGTSHIGLKSPFNEAAFRQAVQDTVARHDVLRVSFELAGYSEPLQVVHAHAVLPLVVEDLRGLSDAVQEQRIKALLERERNTPFDLSKPSLLRFFIQLRGDRSLQFTMTECHPVFDGWSYHTMIVEVFNRYAGLNGDGSFAEPAPLAVNYRDFIEMELAAVADPAHQNHWADKLADCTILRLPRLAGAQPKGTSPVLKALRLDLPETVYGGLQRLMHDASVPMKSVLLAGHVKVMSLITGETDILTGIPTNGRPEEVGGDQLYGLFLNTLPFRFKLARDASWTDTVRAVFAGECEDMPYRRFPLAEIQRRFGREPLLDDVLFNYMDFHVYDQLDADLGFEVVDTLDSGEVNEGTNFTLNVHFQHLTLSSKLQRKQLSIQIDYDATQLSRAQAEQLSAFYLAVFTAMAETPAQPHHARDFLPAALRGQVLEQFSGAGVDYQGQDRLAALFAEQVARRPDGVALTDGDQEISYRQLNERANQLAHHLAAIGVVPGQRVGLHLARSVDLIVAILAVVKSEAVYVPMDVDDPRERIDTILHDSDCRVVLTQERYRARFNADTPLVLLERMAGALSALPVSDPAPTLPVAAPAYVMYTSGSTGKPKGAIIGQRGVARLVKQTGYLDFERNGRVLQLSSVCFDASTLEIWGALLNGGTLILYPDTLPSIPVLETIIAQQRVQTLFLTTSLFNAVVDEKPQVLAPLRHVITGGEAMSPAHARKLLAVLPQLRLTNGYGPTENTTFTTTHELTLERTDGKTAIPLGRPIAHTQVYVLDQFMHPVPPGTPGELYAGGDGVGEGYLKRDDLTAASFLPDPFRVTPGALLYRTGDLASFDADGVLRYLGRIDGQVKIRGFRIELGEIESALCRHAKVRQAAARVIEEGGAKRIAAYVVADSALEGDTLALKTHLAQHLPKYMLPAYVVFLPALPLTRNGKLDARRLPPPAPPPAPRAADPANDLEREIAALWAQVLRVAQPGIDDNFFDLGGDSLLLARVHQQLRARGHATLAIVDLLNYPTIRALAGRLHRAGASSGGIAVPLIEQQLGDGRRRLAQLHQQKQRA